MELFFAEHKKLWSRNYVKVSVLLCFVYIVVFGGILQYQWFSLGSSKDITGNHFDGYEYIRGRQEYAKKYGPKLTDETLAEMAMDYQRAANSDNDEEIKLSDWSVISSWMQFLYPEQQRADTYQLMLGYVDPEALTDLYGRRQNAIDEYMEASGIDGKEKEYLLSMNDKVEIPFSYVWTEGWRTVLGHMLPDFGMMLAIVIVICLAPIFSGEWHDRTGAMILTMKQGWKKDARAKVAVGFCFAVELFLLISIPSIIVQMVYLGTQGWDTPIQCIKMLAIAPMNMLQAEVYEYMYTLIGIIGFTGLVMLISAFSKNDVLSIVGGFALLLIPLIISEYLPYTLQIIISIFPLAGDAADIFRMNTLNVFGKPIWLPYIELMTPFLFALVSIPVTASRWAKIQKS